MMSVLHEATVVADRISIDQVADLIKRPPRHVKRLILGERKFTTAEVVVIARALGEDWRPLLREVVRPRHCSLN